MPAVDPSPVVCIGPAIAWHGEAGACPHAAVLAWDGATARRRRSTPKRCAECKRERKRRLMAYSRGRLGPRPCGDLLLSRSGDARRPALLVRHRDRLPDPPDPLQRLPGTASALEERVRPDRRGARLRPRRGRAAPPTDHRLRRHPPAPGTGHGPGRIHPRLRPAVIHGQPAFILPERRR